MATMTDNFTFQGQCNFQGNVYLPAGTIDNADIASNAAIAASKLLVNRDVVVQLAEPATAIVAINQNIFAAQGAGTILAFKAWIEVIATDVSRTVTVDLHKSTAGGAWATVLSATVGFTTSSSVRTLVSGTVSSAAYIAGDLFRAVVTVAGGSGTQAKGLAVQLTADESYA